MASILSHIPDGSQRFCIVYIGMTVTTLLAKVTRPDLLSKFLFHPANLPFIVYDIMKIRIFKTKLKFLRL